MDMNEYQSLALRTRGETPDGLAMTALGVAGEAGEVADYIKKVVYHGHVMDKEKLTKELGDVLWYIAVMAAEQGISFQEVAEKNIAKLKARYPEGFSSKASINRVKE